MTGLLCCMAVAVATDSDLMAGSLQGIFIKIREFEVKIHFPEKGV